jgi:hypothetical protein
MAEAFSTQASASGQPSIADAFRDFLGNLALDNDETISLRYGEITGALNKKFRDTESKTANSLQVGSYGRKTAIKGISDLDMLYIMPAGSWDTYKDNKQSKLLRDAANAISDRYPTTTVRIDRLVVQILYNNFQIEVQPVFLNGDGSSYTYPDTYGGGKWKVTKPRQELAAMAETDAAKNKNLRRLCRMARAWKNKHGVAMGGLLIDTLAHRFLTSTTEYDDKSYLYYDFMVRDFFDYLANLDPAQTEYGALGSGQRVKVKKCFQAKAKKAHRLTVQAIEADDKPYRNDRWRKVFGRPFPPRAVEVKKAYVVEGGIQAKNTEEFIEDRYPVDIRYPIRIDCEVRQNGFPTFLLRKMLVGHLPLFTSKSLRFFVASHGIPDDLKFKLHWKVLNRGPVAIRRDCIRGQIILDAGRLEKIENTQFQGDHIVECYAVVNGVVVATDRIHVPIEPEGQR